MYPGKLQVSEAYCTVPVNGETTIADLIRESLICFGLENFRCEDYRLSEILLDRGGTFCFRTEYVSVLSWYALLYVQPVVIHLVMKFLVFFVTHKFITMFTKAHHVILS